MKILILHCKYQHRGGEDFVVEEEMALLSKKYKVDILTFQNRAGWKGAFSMILYPFNLMAARKLRQKIRSFHPGIIHLHNFHYAAGPLLIRIAKSENIPVVMTLHNFRLLCPSATLYHKGNDFKHSLTQNFPWTAVRMGVISDSVLKTFWAAFTMWLHKKIGTFNFINTFIALNASQKEIFINSHLQVPCERFVVKPNFCAPAQFPSNIGRCDHFLYIGRLSEEKGIESLLKAFASSSAKIRIAGGGPLEEEVRRYSKNYKNIVYLGELTKNEVITELSQCSALVFSSVCTETFGLAIIEAFSSGTPVIASKIGAAADIVQDRFNGLHFHPLDSTDLIQKIEYYRELPEDVRKTMSLNAFNSWQLYYTPERNLKLLEDIYSKAIRESG